ncbi:MAG: hypothetical protein ACEQSR_03870 [Candidatus Methylacidiphilales bacterium]
MPTYKQLKEHDRVMKELGLDYYGNVKNENLASRTNAKPRCGKHQYRKIKTECGDIYWVCQCGKTL